MRHSFTFALFSLVSVAFAAPYSPADSLEKYCPKGFRLTISNGCSGTCDDGRGTITEPTAVDGTPCYGYGQTPGICRSGECSLFTLTANTVTCVEGTTSLDECNVACTNPRGIMHWDSLPDRTLCKTDEGQPGVCFTGICDPQM
ncbi:hypothetical protein BOTBODRAFT_189127 [Botryobasidium botryosum FD-172 SS1]|uniref:Uncharacterized protein n=1 Tax=Botryobasidium botryosum (strain FD-172 SS1) TaxID=930990 RepID=A0A067MM30_BOTB1|nr:hypothetical protein BOTBODRAFT_189127 [Botryobasidium botryosum FD-172 SS1]